MRLTSQDVHSVTLASPTTEGNCGPCLCPVVDALKARVTLDDLLVIITTMLSALQATFLNLSLHSWMCQKIHVAVNK